MRYGLVDHFVRDIVSAYGRFEGCLKCLQTNDVDLKELVTASLKGHIAGC